MPIRWKITILSFGVVLFSLLIALIIFVGKAIDLKEEELGNRALIISRTVANLPTVQDYLETPNGWKYIQPVVENIRTVNGSDYIVVLNMNRIRYSHPSEELLGTLSSGKDEGPAFAEHSYISKGKGEIGTAIRGFVPIMNENHQQIGVVIVGVITPSVWSMINSIKNEIFIMSLLTLLFGTIGSWLLAKHIKKETFQLEPHEIAKLLVERDSTFQAMNDGIIAIDREERITVFNEKAKDILGIRGEVAGRMIKQILPESMLPYALKDNKAIYHEELRLGDKIVLSSRFPILVNNKIVGAVAVIQDRTEIKKLAEELTGVKLFVEALRVQNHEHQNQLHTVAGLIQLDESEKALQYIFQSTEEEANITRFLTEWIKNDHVTGLLLSKIRRGKELGIEVNIDPDCYFHTLPPLVDEHNLVIILGNLIENAFYALKGTRQTDKQVTIYIEENEKLLHIEVEDNGTGISETELPYIFERGFTTKGNHGSGIGLYLIKNIVNKADGDINVYSESGVGTVFQLNFPYGKGLKTDGKSNTNSLN